MASGKDLAGTLIKGVIVLGFGAALGGYIVFMFQSSPPPPSQRAGEDASAITPGSDSKSPRVASTAQPDASTSTEPPDGNSNSGTNDAGTNDSGTNDSGDVTSAPDGQTGPDVDITVKPVTAAQAAAVSTSDHGAMPAEPRRHRRHRLTPPKAKTEPATPKKPPAETFLPDQGDVGAGGTTTGGGTTGGGTGTDGGGSTGGTTGTDGG